MMTYDVECMSGLGVAWTGKADSFQNALERHLEDLGYDPTKCNIQLGHYATGADYAVISRDNGSFDDHVFAHVQLPVIP